MVVLEAVCVFHGRNYVFFNGSAGACSPDGSPVLYTGICLPYFYLGKGHDFRRQDIRLAVSCVHYPADQRRAVLLYGHSWTVSCQDLSGGEAPTDLSD